MTGSVGAVILSGGRSSRFGADKARVEIGGKSLLARVLDAAAPMVDDVLVVGPWAPAGVRTSLEPDPDRGPLCGLAWGLHEIGTEHALVLACDHPLLAGDLLRLLVSCREEVSAVVPRGPEGPEPLVAVYAAECAQIAASLLESGEGRLGALLDAVDVVWVDESQWLRADPYGRSFLDVDTQTDLDTIARLVGPDANHGEA